MSQNPYEGPEADVADPVAVELPQPPEVTRALWILWISLGANLVSLVPSIRGQWWVPEPESGENFVELSVVIVGFTLALVGLNMWLIWMVGRGRNWARWALLACFAVGWLFLLSDFPRSITETPLGALADVLISAAEIWASYLLFRDPGAAWFTRGT